MASTYTLESKSYDGRKLVLTCTQTKDTANNRSKIEWTLKSTGGNSNYYSTGPTTVKIAGTQRYYKARVAWSSETFPAAKGSTSGEFYVNHNSDGTKSISVSLTTAIFTESTSTKSGTWDLDSIARASTISATNANVEEQSTISVNRKSSNYTHTITWACGSANGTVVTKSSNTSIKWTLPDTLYAQIGSTAKEKTVTLTCVTYNGSGNQVGSAQTCTLKAMTSQAKNAPILNPTVTDTGTVSTPLTGNGSSILIKGFNAMNWSIGASAQDGATLVSQKVVCGNFESTAASGSFNHVTSGTFTFTATDSRGYTSTVTKTFTVKDYFKPGCAMSVKITPEGTATLSANGGFFNASFGAKSNNLNIAYRYKAAGGSYTAWTAFSSAGTSGNTWNASSTLTGLNYRQVYYFQAQVVDATGNSAQTAEIKVVGYPVWDWGKNNFHIHGDLRLDNNYCYTGKRTNGSKFNIAHVNDKDEVVFGGGSYPPTNMVMAVNAGGNVKVGTGAGYYSILGAAKAMSNVYDLPVTVSVNTSLYESGSASARLAGNNVRLGISAVRKSAISSPGNTDNETVMTITLNHGGKIKDLYRVDFNTGATGGLAGLVASCTTSGNTSTITVLLVSTTNNLKQFDGYTSLPCILNLDAYIE